MSERAKLLKVSAFIASFTDILCLIIIIYVLKCSVVYPYLFWIISFICCMYLWKSYIDEKKNNRKSN